MIVKVNTHPIVVGVHEEYHIDWCGSLIDVHPQLRNGLPIFYIRGKDRNVELNTIDMKAIENVAKNITNPYGRGSVTTDKSYIYILEEDGNKKLLGIVTHSNIKDYRQMYDEFEYY